MGELGLHQPIAAFDRGPSGQTFVS
jgi:hypothetical protein